MRALFVFATVVSLICLQGRTPSASAEGGPTGPSNGTVFLQQAPLATLEYEDPNIARIATLVMHNVSLNTTWISAGSPARAGALATATLAAGPAFQAATGWLAQPNAALAGTDPSGLPVHVALTLYRPALNTSSGTLSYDVLTVPDEEGVELQLGGEPRGGPAPAPAPAAAEQGPAPIRGRDFTFNNTSDESHPTLHVTNAALFIDASQGSWLTAPELAARAGAQP